MDDLDAGVGSREEEKYYGTWIISSAVRDFV